MANPLSDKRKLITLLKGALALSAVLLISAACQTKRDERSVAEPQNGSAQRDEAASRAAFLAAYPVLMHPRCMNCHPKGDAPLQGDDSHVHIQNVKRGTDGHGKYGMKCSA